MLARQWYSKSTIPAESQPKDKKHHHWLLVVAGLIVGLLAGALVVFIFFWREPAIVVTPGSAPVTSTENVRPPTTETKTEETSSKITVPDDWETYGSYTYGVSFRYPTNWGAPELTEVTGDVDSLYGFPEEDLTFDTGGQNGYRSVRIASVSDMRSFYTPSTTGAATDLDQLLTVYRDRTVGDIEPPVVPPVNAGVAATTKPTHIESTNGQFRGVYYYAFFTQNDFPKDPTLLTDLVLVMTDGTVVLNFSRISNYGVGTSTSEEIVLTPEGGAAPAETCEPADISEFTPTRCEIDTILLQEFEATYRVVISSLSSP